MQSYVTWTNASEPLQFLIDDNEGLRKASVHLNIVNPLPSYNKSYSVALLDRYLQPQVSSTYRATHATVTRHFYKSKPFCNCIIHTYSTAESPALLLSHMAFHHFHHLHYYRLHLLLLAQYFILNSRPCSSANSFLHRPFPFLLD